MITEVPTPKASKPIIPSRRPSTKVRKADSNDTSDLMSVSRRLLSSYVWDSCSPSHTSGASNTELSLTLPEESKRHDITSDTTEFMYLYDTYLHHLEPIFPKFEPIDANAMKERIATGLITPVDKAIIACAAAQLSVTGRNNTAVNYHATCHRLINQAQADVKKESKDGECVQLSFFFSVCYLLVPDIQQDDRYLAHFIKKATQKTQLEADDAAAIDNGARNEENAVRKFWIMYLLYYCKYQNGNLRTIHVPDDSAIRKKIALDVGEDEQHFECCIFLSNMSSLMQLRLSIQEQLVTEKQSPHEHYEQLKKELTNWRNALPDSYDKVYQTMDNLLVQRNMKGTDIDWTSKYGELSHYALLSRFIYTGTALLLEEFLYTNTAKRANFLNLKLATSVMFSLEAALLRTDFSKALYLIAHRLMLEDCLRSFLVMLYTATSRLTNYGDLDSKLSNLVIRASSTIKKFLHEIAAHHKQENLSQLEAEIHNRSLLKKIESLRGSQRNDNQKVIPTIPTVDSVPAAECKPAGIPAAPSSSVTIPLFSTYEILFGAESALYNDS